ncbi:unnamed protein product, partial [marine sediment metagenome]
MKHTKGKWTYEHIRYADNSGGNYYVKDESDNNFITIWGEGKESKAIAKLV